jgi:hypothetical protein
MRHPRLLKETSMQTRLVQIGERIVALEKLADEVGALVQQQFQGNDVQPDLSLKGEKWYRGARQLLVECEFSGLKDFDECYTGASYVTGLGYVMRRRTLGSEGEFEVRRDFDEQFRRARGLLGSLVEEITSKELLTAAKLSFAIAADEFETARNLCEAAQNDEALLRASGVVARVALERHLFTVADSRQIQIQVNPSTKKKPEVEDVLVSLTKGGVINAIQKAELDSLFKVANNCAHPKECVQASDVKRLIERGREMASVIS